MKEIERKSETDGGETTPKDHEEKEDGPFIDYGFSIDHFFTVQGRIIKVFAQMIAISILQILCFTCMDGLHYFGEDINWFPTMSFGNIGFQEKICVKVPFKIDQIKLEFSCQKTTTIQDISESGLILSEKLSGDDRIISTCLLSEQEK